MDFEPHFSIHALQVDTHRGRLGVARHVGQRLLGDPEQVRFGLVGHARFEVRLEGYLQTRSLLNAVAEPAQAGLQTEIVEDRRPQQLRKFAHIANGLVDQLDGILDPRLPFPGHLRQRHQVGLQRAQGLP